MKKLSISVALVVVILLYVAYEHFNAHTVTAPIISQTQVNSNVAYKNGTYTGTVADAYYGSVQVQATVVGGRLAAVTFLQYPNDRSTSRSINGQAMPYLEQEAIAAQGASVNVVSGATDTSHAFVQSLQAALNQAKA